MGLAPLLEWSCCGVIIILWYQREMCTITSLWLDGVLLCRSFLSSKHSSGVAILTPNCVSSTPLMSLARARGVRVTGPVCLYSNFVPYVLVALYCKLFRFLWGTYRPAVYFYEVWECVRKLLLTGLLVYFEEGTASQVRNDKRGEKLLPEHSKLQ